MSKKIKNLIKKYKKWLYLSGALLATLLLYYPISTWYNNDTNLLQPPINEVQETKWDEEHPNGNGIIKDYQRKINDNLTIRCTYQLNAHSIIKIKRTFIQKGQEDQVDYFLLRNLDLSDAQQIHDLIKDSDPKHFGLEPTFDDYSKSKEQVEVRIMKILANNDQDTKGLFYAENPETPYQFIGFISSSTLDKEDKVIADKDNHVKSISYVLGDPAITKVKGAATPAVYAYISALFYYSNKPVDSIIAHIHTKNTRSQRMMGKLFFTQKGKDYNTISYAENRPRREMIPYQLTQQKWINYYTKSAWRRWAERIGKCFFYMIIGAVVGAVLGALFCYLFLNTSSSHPTVSSVMLSILEAIVKGIIGAIIGGIIGGIRGIWLIYLELEHPPLSPQATKPTPQSHKEQTPPQHPEQQTPSPQPPPA